ncbi:Vacuolar protein sorting-associated protein 13C [Myotis davidii]|uniref:Vacuolar protein sorting-associated protein 13C n=1 Tax=Myotis davidii TaxID=225400 RepID=L5LY24_MYODS|nr:Vacuolar protein sorting-associated protein 13C [Myotis davidii]
MNSQSDFEVTLMSLEKSLNGNVALDNLKIKENALSELDVPFKVKAGQINKLTLKIPWKNLYGEAVVATLEGLYLLVVPGASIKYDAEKEEKSLQDIKQKELSRIEEALQKAAEKDKPKEAKKDTFLEKLATQVIKNVQVKITDIHIKYEDDVTDPKRPLSFGVTLGELSLLTANEHWTPCVLNEADKIIYKLVRLDSLSAYWNVNCSMSYQGSREQILDHLKSEILTSNDILPSHQYIFQPISASAKLYMNPYAETELKTPKLDGNIEVQNIAIELTKPQYLSMIDLLESVDYMVRNAPYRKYKPYVPLHTNGRQWWKYAIDSILEVHIRRCTHMWSWSNIKNHRQLLKSYKCAYKTKLTQTKVPEEIQKQIQDLEKTLDVFNIILARQQAQVEVIRSGQKLKNKSTDAGEKRGGWFSGFWGKKESKKKDEESLIPETIDDLMTPEEKDKFFTAIGYSESTHNLTLPKQYVAHIMTLKLVSTSITIRENKNIPEILKIQIIGLGTKVSQRPGAQALKVEAKLEHWYITGLKQQDTVPSLVASIGDTASSLLKIEFETNPENSTADQTLVLQSQPVEVIYDAKTINAVVEFFQSNKGLDLEQITSATLMKLEEIKERTATGLTHIIETRKVLDLKINLKPSYLIVPHTGFYHKKSNLLILDFGTFQLNSKDQGLQKNGNSSLEEIMDKAYDKFDVEIKSVQLLFARAEENWKKCRFQHPSTMHILQPMDIHVELAKAMVEKDIRMARFKVSGGLPLMHVRISDQKMKNVLCLINSIPLPQKSSVQSPERQVSSIPVISDRTKDLLGTSLLLDGVESESDDEYFDAEDGDIQTGKSMKGSERKKVAEAPNEELINLLLKFEIKEVILEFTKQQKEEDTILVFNVTQLGTEATVRTFDLTAVSYLKKISLDYHEIQGSKKKPLHLISSSDKPGLDLLKVEYIKADKNGPSFQTTFEKTEQTVKVAFSSLNLLLQTQALLSSINYLTTIIPSDGHKMGDAKEVQISTEKQQKNSALQKVIVSSKDSDIIDFRLFAKLNAFCINVCEEKNNIAEIKIQGLDASLLLQSRKQSLFARLENIIVTDVEPKTVHKKVVSIMGNEVFRFNLDLYPDATEGDFYTDMSKVDGVVSLNVGCIQIVYLHKFLMSFLNFLNNFQTAKEALSAATAQAAEKAATSVKDLAQRSFRVSINIDLKAPVIVIPQSSISTNAVVVDLGLMRVQNQFSLVSGEDFLNPPVIDRMDVQLTKLKLSRTVIQPGISHPDIQLLHPINLEFSVNRNLAASWYHKVPVVEIKGHLESMNVNLNQEDLNLLFRILAENLGEATEDLNKVKPRTQETGVSITGSYLSFSNICHIMPNRFSSGHTSLLSYEQGEYESSSCFTSSPVLDIVVLTLMKKAEKKGRPLHELNVLQLGVEARVKTYDLTAKAYLKKISMRCFEFTDSKGEPLHIINSSNVTDEPLLKMLLTKADCDGPEFKTIHDNTKQRLKVSFSSLDLVLHLEALLSLMGFLSSAVPSSEPSEKESELKPLVGESRSLIVKAVSSNTSQDDVFDLKIMAELNSFNVFVCDQKCSIADIRIHGMDASISVKPKQTDMFARLQDIIVTNVDLMSIHKKAVSILGDEVFRFQMTLYPDATEGKAYADMSKVDGKLSLKVGCIQIVYVHKFFMSLLNFLNNFQTAKEALSAATVQAAERAASSMKDLAQKSFRLLMDINLKAPVIIIPQSSVSPNAVIADLGLIRVENKFSLVPMEHSSLPPVIDKMNIQLTQLKLSRTILQADLPQYDIEILKPVNMLLSIQRNLAATWYVQIPGMEIKGKLKPMQVALSEDDLTVLMKILLENLGEASSQPSPTQSTQEAVRVRKDVLSGPDHLKEQDLADTQLSVDQSVTLQFDFHFESLSIVLYNNDTNQESKLSFHNDSFRLGELRLHFMASSGKMFKDSSMNVGIKLKTCTLDDLREGIERATSRMIDRKNDQDNNSSMIDISYKQGKDGRSHLDAVLDKLYVCASVEFLMTVADFFIKAMPQSPENMAKEVQIPLRQTSTAKLKIEKDDSVRPNMTLKARVTDPEVVFVANLTKADAPALTASFQCDLSLSTSKLEQMMEASISPIILNTVMTIMAALSPKTKEDEFKDTSKETGNLWGVKSISDYNSWFLGVDMATEITENFRGAEQPLIEENCAVAVESVQVTLECGLGHQTVPLLLAESKFSGNIKNWTSFMAASADMTLEVKKNPVQDKSLMPGDDFIFLPEPQTAVHISSGDTMNITISKSCLNVFNNLAKGFSEGTASTFDYSLKDKPPFTIKNALGVPTKVQPNHNLRVMGSPEKSDIYDVHAGQNLELEYASREPSCQGKLSILSRQESSFFTLTFVPHGYTEVAKVPIVRPGRQLYNVRNPNASHSDSVLVQIDATEGNKVITLRSPLQIKNHFSIAFIIYKSVKNVKLLERIGVARPEEEFHVPLDSYSPYWLINKTSRVLQYRSEDIHVGVSIKMSSFNLTRIVTLTPFCTIANKSSLELEVGEIAPDGSMPTNKWNYIASSECLPFWPENLSGKLCVRVVGCEGSSKPFFYNRQDNGTLLSLEDLNGGILVDVNTAEHSTVITFSDYHEGSAPALIINHTPWDILTYKQSGLQEEVKLLPRQARLFAWADPTGTRKLTWRYAANIGQHDLLKDECGQFPYDANIQIHWVSFLDGRQRVLLFTDDVALVSKALQAEEMEHADHEITFSLHSLGLSLVNNEKKQEVSYIGITSSGVVWEMKPKQKWKPFSQKHIMLLEQSYKKYQAAKQHGWIKLDNNFEVNFDKTPMEMRLPVPCPIKRDFLSGIQIEFKQSPHQRSLRARLYWLQVDNQLPGTMFPVVFHPVAPPKSIALDSEPKPFIDVSVITRFNEYSKVLQFKYFMVLIQEMALKVDQGFLGAIIALFTPATDPEAERKRTKLIQQDIDALNTELMETSMTDMSVLSFFEHFHISPVKLHLSLSLGSGGEESDKEKQEMIAIHSINLLLKSIGATLTDVDDLIFKLAYYEIRYQFYKRDQLMWSVVRHYSEQFLKQMYVLVLGLDVLGNPFGLLRGLSEGVEALFYEPFQGAVQGPEEFAEGLVIGVRSLFGHTVGGAAGVVSRITGSVGKGLAAITLDKEYQQKRREEMGRQPKDFGDSLARGGKGFLRGVVGGVTGIITKPMEGAKKEGAAGFFKGIGKGLVGAVAGPTGGIIDMASSTFQGIQRAAESTEEVSRLRPPRLIHEDGIIRPYDRQESEGYDLYENHVKKLEGEMYRYHCAISGSKRTVLMITNRRVVCIKEVEILGLMCIDWQCLFEDFVFPPSVNGNLLNISVKDQSMFHKKDSANQSCLRKIYLLDTTTAERACHAIEDAQSMRHQQNLRKQSSLKLLRP